MSTDRTLQPLTPLLDDQGRPDWIATAYNERRMADNLRRELRHVRAGRAALHGETQRLRAEVSRLRDRLGEVAFGAGESDEARQAA